MVEAAYFIPLIIVAITQLIKMAVPKVAGWVTILVAFLVGIAIALLDVIIGVVDINIAEGIVFALEAIGLSVLVGKAGGGTKGDENREPIAR